MKRKSKTAKLVALMSAFIMVIGIMLPSTAYATDLQPDEGTNESAIEQIVNIPQENNEDDTQPDTQKDEAEIAVPEDIAIPSDPTPDQPVMRSAGNPYPQTYTDSNGYHPGNCTWQAWEEAYLRLGIKLPAWGNAGGWLERAQSSGYSITRYSSGAVPPKNSIIEWAGHVGWVISADQNGATIREGNILLNGRYVAVHEQWWSWATLRQYRGNPRGWINLSGGSGGNPQALDLGQRFQGLILRTDVWKPIINKSGNVQLASARDDSTEKWWFERQSDGSYTIESLKDNKMMDSAGWETGTKVKVRDANGSASQRWFIYNFNGCYRFVPSNSTSQCLYLEWGNSIDNTNVVLGTIGNNGAQMFSIWRGDETEKFRNMGEEFSGLLMNTAYWKPVINNKEGNAVLWDELGVPNEKWRFIRQDDGSYLIKSLYDGQVLDVYHGGSTDKTNVGLCPPNGNNAQKWFVYPHGNNLKLVPKNARKLCLDLDWNSSANGTNIQICIPNGTYAQQFSVYGLHEQPMLESVSIDTSEGTNLVVGDTLKLTGKLYPTKPINSHILWSSNNTSVATVDSNGIVTGKSPGTATIQFYSAYDNNIKATVVVEVLED